MKAALLKQAGTPEDFSKNIVIADVPVPQISEDEILIKVKYASINHRDIWIAKGAYSKIKLPVILGSDCSGVVHAIGKNVLSFKTGEDVIINPGLNWGNEEDYQSKDFMILGMPENGTFAEYVKIHQSYVYKKPAHLDHLKASAIALTGITSYTALFRKANIKKDDNILITGIGGGVSSFALLFAVSIGANVFVTSGKVEKITKAISFGAKDGVNYNDPDWDKKLIELTKNKIDVVIDGAGGDTYLKCIEIIGYGGRIVSYGATQGNVNFPMARLFWKQLKIYGTTMGSPSGFSDMMKFIDEKKISPVIDEVFSLENISGAFKRMNDSKQFGKIVIKIEEWNL